MTYLELIRVRIRQRPQQHAVDDAEDGGVGADAERERQHGERRESRLTFESAERVEKVFSQVVHDGLDESSTGLRRRCGKTKRGGRADRVGDETQPRERGAGAAETGALAREARERRVLEIGTGERAEVRRQQAGQCPVAAPAAIGSVGGHQCLFSRRLARAASTNPASRFASAAHSRRPAAVSRK